MPPCSPWATVDDLCSPCSDLTAEQLAAMGPWFVVASEVLYELSGQRWTGVCTETVRPSPCQHITRCGCSGVSQFPLPQGPVVEVTEVRVDGVVVPAGEYRVDDRRWLVGLQLPDGTRRRWPSRQDLALPTTEVGTWSITYDHGAAPPAAGITAAAALACELFLACSGGANGGACRLPERVQSVVREGVTYTMLDSLDLFAQGRTGLPEVDLWLGSLVTGQSRRRGTLVDPARRGGVRRTG